MGIKERSSESRSASAYRTEVFDAFADQITGEVNILGLLDCVRVVRDIKVRNGTVDELAQELTGKIPERLGTDGFSTIIWAYLENCQMFDTLLRMQDQANSRD